ncbi:sulfurtransferase [Schaalia sp.]|uniref:sulfurtransferase n=1 Tax=Schaalia sp. TaxID=2691890 RepID=UPI003D128896
MATSSSPLLSVEGLVALLDLDPGEFPVTGSIPVLIDSSKRPAASPGPDSPVILDIRYPGPGSQVDGRAQYLAGHIPGAVYVSLDEALAAPHRPGRTGRHPIPDLDVFETAMRLAGVSGERPVIVYDDWFSIAAARAWWLLTWAGHSDVRVLDGGWKAWRDACYPVHTGQVDAVPGDFRAVAGHRPLIDAEGAARISASGVLLDARPANRFRGEDETVDPVAGHIPGARSLPALSLVDESGRFLDSEELVDRFESVGALDAGDVGVYCGSGLQASHVILAAEASGALEGAALYVGSWSDWITDPARPVE